jgi:hypothetical protein
MPTLNVTAENAKSAEKKYNYAQKGDVGSLATYSYRSKETGGTKKMPRMPKLKEQKTGNSKKLE